MIIFVLWAIGFLTGLLIFLFSVSLFVFKLFIQPKLVRRLPEFIKAKPLPEAIIADLRKAIGDEKSGEKNSETTLWLNGLVQWFFLNLSDSSPFRSGVKQVLSEIMVDLRRTPLGYLLTGSEIDSLDLYNYAPKLENVKVISGSSLHESTETKPLALQFDIEYRGACRIRMQFSTVFRIFVQVETVIEAFKASLCLVIRDKTVHICFLDEPEVLKSNTLITFNSSIQVLLLNRLFSGGWLFKKAINSGCKFPVFLNQWYRAGPEQPPYPWHPQVLKNPDLLYTWTPKQD